VTVKFVCPDQGCRRKLKAPPSLVGRRARCPHCRRVLVVPKAGLAAVVAGPRRPSASVRRRRRSAVGEPTNWALAAGLVVVAVLGTFLSARAAQYLAESPAETPAAGPERLLVRAADGRARPSGNQRVATDEPGAAQPAGSSPVPKTTPAASPSVPKAAAAGRLPPGEVASDAPGPVPPPSPSWADWLLSDLTPGAGPKGFAAPGLSPAARSLQRGADPPGKLPAAQAKAPAKHH
jgi:hypothetical protein